MANFDLLPLLKISETQQFDQFLHDSVDELVEKSECDCNKYLGKELDWSKDDCEKAKSCIKSFFRQYVLANKLEIQSETLSDDAKRAIGDCYEIKKDVIFQALAKEDMLSRGCNLAENFDWRIKWILGSSDLASLREPVLQMDFICCKKSAGKTVRDIVNFEANLEQVDNLIKELSVVKQQLDE